MTPGRIEGARRATLLRYGGSLWVNGYWPDTTVSIELRPVRRSLGRVLLMGPPSEAGRSIAVDLGRAVSLEAFAGELAGWIEMPSLVACRAERAWTEVARGIAAALVSGTREGIPA